MLHVFAVKEVLQIAISSWVARFIVSRIFLNVSVAAFQFGGRRPR